MKGVVLAAGKGSRLYPVTKAVPKPLLPIANRPTLAYAFDQFRDCGIHEVCVVIGDNERPMRESLGDGSAFGLAISYARQTEPLGLAHAVSFTTDFVAGDDFMLYLGDAIYDQSLAPYVGQFYESGCANLNLVREVENPRRFGVANVVDGRIVKLVEKPAVPESNLAMAGMYIFGPQIWDVLPSLSPSARGEYEITDAIQTMVDQGHLVVPGVYPGRWFDTGTLESFLETSRFLTNSGVLAGDGSDLVGEAGSHVVLGEGSRVRCAAISDSIVLPGAQILIGGKIQGCLLGGVVERVGDLVDTVAFGDLA